MDDLFSLKIRKNQEEAEQLQKRLVKARYEKLLEMLLLLLSLAIISPGGKKILPFGPFSKDFLSPLSVNDDTKIIFLRGRDISSSNISFHSSEKKRFMLDEKFQRNTSKFAIFHILYGSPKFLFLFSFLCYFSPNECSGLC